MANNIFISYAREDSEFALRLYDDLRSAGADVWLDQRDIEPGQRWDDAVQNALKACDSFLPILSLDSVNSEQVQDEYSYALDEEKQILPVLHRPCEIPFRLRRFQNVDFTADYNTGIAKLRSTLTDSDQGLEEGTEQPEDDVREEEAVPEVKPEEDKVATDGQERQEVTTQAEEREEVTSVDGVPEEGDEKEKQENERGWKRLKKWQTHLEIAGLILAIITGIFTLSKDVRESFFGSDPTNNGDTFSLVVRVHDEAGKPLESGAVWLNYGQKSDQEPLASDGEATFAEISQSFRKEQAKIRVVSDGYVQVKADSSFSLSNPVVEIVMKKANTEEMAMENIDKAIRNYEAGAFHLS